MNRVPCAVCHFSRERTFDDETRTEKDKGPMLPTIEWKGKHIRMIDQRKLPAKVEWVVCKDDKGVITSIRDMVIRGAPAIGVAAAMGLSLGAETIKAETYGAFERRFREMAARMVKARPTAVNLRWAVERMILLVEQMAGMDPEEIRIALREESEKILSEDIEINRKIGEHGNKIVPRKAVILTHCNAGSLATGGYGTALGVIRAAHLEFVYCALKPDRSLVHDVTPVAQTEGQAHIVLADEHGQSQLLDLPQLLFHSLDHQRSQTFTGLIQKEEPGIRHQGSCDGQHLLLPATELGSHAFIQHLQYRKQAINPIQIPDSPFPLYPTDHNVLANRQIRKYTSCIGNISDPHPGNGVRGFSDDFFSQKSNTAGLWLS